MKKAFTTAELLISLIVIGVIAALVIPVFTKDYNTRIRTAAIKDSYATIMSAIQRACADKNVTYFSQTGYMDTNNDSEKVKEFLHTYIRGKESNVFASKYNQYNGTGAGTQLSSQGIPVFYKMQNGSALGVKCEEKVQLSKYDFSKERLVPNGEKQGVCGFYIDVNGPSKPNMGGVDMFHFVIGSKTNEVVVRGDNVTTACRSSYYGANCVYQLIINDWNINQLATENYPRF